MRELTFLGTGRRNLHLHRISLLAALLFIVGLLLTFPPFMDLLQGK